MGMGMDNLYICTGYSFHLYNVCVAKVRQLTSLWRSKGKTQQNNLHRSGQAQQML